SRLPDAGLRLNHAESRLPDSSGWGSEVEVVAAAVHEGSYVGYARAFDDVTDEDPVVAGLDGLLERANDVGGDVVLEHRAAACVRASPVERLELVFRLGGHEAGKRFAARGEDVGREAVGVPHGGQRVGELVDAGERERRFERHRA